MADVVQFGRERRMVTGGWPGGHRAIVGCLYAERATWKPEALSRTHRSTSTPRPRYAARRTTNVATATSCTATPTDLKRVTSS